MAPNENDNNIKCFIFYTGVITYDDFVTLMSIKMADKDSREEIIKAFKLFDDNCSGKITFNNLKRIARELGENIADEELQVKNK